MHETRTSFGQLLRRLRSAAALSQEDLAERAGLSRHGISDLERGARHAPRLETVRMLADALTLEEPDRQALLKAARPALLGNEAHVAALACAVLLPAPLTRLIGRETELAALSAGLQDGTRRLLTITGPGGVGKTRLAVEVINGLHTTFPDGVAFIDLSPLSDHALVVPTIAVALGVQEAADQALLDRLSLVLADKRQLLVLDNCEPVLGAAPDLATLLAGCPQVTILATSREPWRLRGEQEFPLRPLPLPDADLLQGDTALAENPAVALFVERATAGRPDFALSEEGMHAVATVCQRLDGLPLAIELAAAWIKVLPPDVLLTRLESRLPMLIGGPRDAPARQRTMHDTIAWSYELLTEEEQGLLRRIAIFVGGFSLEAAEAVAGRGGSLAVLMGIASLVDKSLLRQEAGPEGEPRYWMLETIREFGCNRLAAQGEATACRQRQAAWCLALAEAAELELLAGSGHARWMERLAADLPNLRATIAWLLGTGDGAGVLRVLAATLHFWTQRPQYGEVRQWLDTALATAPDAPAYDRALGLHCLLMTDDCRTDLATAHATASLAAAKESAHLMALGLAHHGLGMVRASRGDLHGAAQANAAAAACLQEGGTTPSPPWPPPTGRSSRRWLGMEST